MGIFIALFIEAATRVATAKNSTQEEKVQTSVLPADSGRCIDGVVSLVTKRRGNKFHGGVSAPYTAKRQLKLDDCANSVELAVTRITPASTKRR
ncbi:MAG: hypothetical protein ABSE51_02400 [Terracidiphilus sp.]